MTIANTYDIGAAVVVTGTFRNAAGDLANPTTATVLYRRETDTELSDTPTNASTGVYNFTITPTQDGKWFYRFKGTGAVTAAGESFFIVRESAFVNP